MSTIEKLNEVFQDVFEDDDLTVTPSTTAEEVGDWDSLMHVALIVEVESQFGVKFTSAEVASLQSVGDLVELIDSHSVLAR